MLSSHLAADDEDGLCSEPRLKGSSHLCFPSTVPRWLGQTLAEIVSSGLLLGMASGVSAGTATFLTYYTLLLVFMA